MSREMSSPAAEQVAGREKIFMRAGMAAGILAVATIAATAKPRPAQAEGYGIDLVGFTDNTIFNSDLSVAEAEATRIVQMGGNAVRFIYPLNKGTAWENYAQETCNAFQAAYDHGLQPITAFQGNDGQPGYVPKSPSEIRQFKTTAASILWTVASNSKGCVPNQKNFIFEGINEINNDKPFNNNLGVNTPAQAASIDYQLSTTLRKEAAKPEINATISYGESLAAANHDPVQFLKDEAQAANTLGVKLKYDFIDIHPYPVDPTADPMDTMHKLYQPAKDAIDTLSPGAQLVFGEYGVNTINPPSAAAGEYQTPVTSTRGVSESTQVKYIADYLKTDASDGTPWTTLMDLQDDGSGNMPSSGEFYVSGNPKSSQPAIRYQIGKYTGR